MSNGRTLQGHDVTVATNSDFITATQIGNKRGIDVNMISGGGAGGGSEASVGSGGYTTGSGDFTATPTVGTKDVVVSGLPFSLTLCSVVGGSATVISSTGVVSAIPTTNISISGSTITFADKTDNFAAGDTVCLSLDGPDKGWTGTSFRQEIINPVNSFRIPAQFSETNAIDGTFEYYIDMFGYRKLYSQLKITPGSGSVTVKFWASARDDGTAASLVDYIDVTNLAYGAASFTTDSFLADPVEFFSGAKWVKIEVVAATGGANDSSWIIDTNKLY
jgi:hypothetical protein